MGDHPAVDWDLRRGRLHVRYGPSGGPVRREEVSTPVSVDLDRGGHVIDVDVAGLPDLIADLLTGYAAFRARRVRHPDIAFDVDARALWLHLGDGRCAGGIRCTGSVCLTFDGASLASVELTLLDPTDPIR